jgi:hypothetical protein
MNDTEIPVEDMQLPDHADYCPCCGQLLPDPHPLDHVELAE